MNEVNTIKNLINTMTHAGSAGIVLASGISEGRTAYAAAQIAGDQRRQMLMIASSYEKAKQLEEYMSFFVNDFREIVVLPDEERSLFSYDAKSRMLSHRRISALTRAMSGEPVIFIAPVMAAAKGTLSPADFRQRTISLASGGAIDRDQVVSRLAEMGYERVDMAEVKGQFSVRGDIIDIFPPDSEDPYRVDIFDTEIDSIKSYDPLSQRSVKNLEAVVVPPAVVLDAESEETACYFWDYLSKDAVIIADDWQRICEQRDLADRDWTAGAAEKGNKEVRRAEIFADMHTIAYCIGEFKCMVTMPLRKQPKYIDKLAESIGVNCMDAPIFGGRLDHYEDELKRLEKNGYEIHVSGTTDERVQSLKDYARRAELEFEIHYEEGFLAEGMYFPEDKLAYISDNNIFKNTKKKRNKKPSGGKQIKAFTDLKAGDYVVHENHGIGRFLGIEPLVIEGIRRDYMTIKYADKDKLYIPVEQMDMIQSYIGSGGEAPKISRLSSGEWKKTKARAKAAIAGMADELLRMSAERKMNFGYSFGPDTPWQRQFEDLFPYQETENQLRCIDEVKADMEMPWPMDRLLCGDVGFGKTEIAARAIFKCVMDGKQAAVLVPTTILADQHYRTFKERFEQFPCTVDLLCRFRSDAEQAETIKRVAEGQVDVLIGTHRMLSQDVKFSDLGLLVIDEEQRFGVQHKEKIKQLKSNVDVLTLTATPIPRTLHMSLSGIRSMSTLEEPPEDRYPVQTYVLEQDDVLVREIIMRELDRGGQVFVVFNRVRGISQIADGLRFLVPDARIAVAHGQMAENKLEDVMTGFINHEYDVLVATTIIESGIDVPNANTLIILDADNFGLSQLYQLKGRVGRSNRAAYAYFMYKKDKVLSEIATKRLRAIREFTEFGSGFRIAMKDLEIRGAGNLLGTEQSGHIMQIGYELYCKLIDDAIRKLRGEAVAEEELEVAIEIKADAFISSDYIADEKLKLDMYKRIAEIASDEDMQDVTDELLDRFGEIPSETLTLMKVALIQHYARTAGIRRIAIDEGRLVFEFEPDFNKLTPELIAKLNDKYGLSMLINLARKPFIKIPAPKAQREIFTKAIEFLSVFAEDKKEAETASVPDDEFELPPGMFFGS